MKTLSVVIPTYNRGDVLLNTIELLLAQRLLLDEIIIVDQTRYLNNDPISTTLKSWDIEKKIRWIQLDKPSIPHAMNVGLSHASSDYVLFLDDDVSFSTNFIAQHQSSLDQSKHSAHVGQILQPWQTEIPLGDYSSSDDFYADLNFPFHSDIPTNIRNCMAGNLCVNRLLAIDVGGFDQQFEGAAYRFETEFCRRMVSHTGQDFMFFPNATLNHLKIETGGTRKNGSNFLTSYSGVHSMGDYYFALSQFSESGNKIAAFKYILRRLLGSAWAKFYLKKPYWIPIRIIGECTGLILACQKLLSGPRYFDFNSKR